MIRFFDISISILSLLVLLPLLVIISSLILMIEGRPIIFKQNRIGRGGKKFVIYKFRTMSNIKYKNEEQRLSNFGKILRKTSLDEIPQLLNVLKNNMSIVGPRPLPESTERKINKILKKKRRKILPGITGYSQINFTGKYRKLTDKVKLDIEFVENYNLINYFIILTKTPFVLLKRFFKNKSSIIK